MSGPILKPAGFLRVATITKVDAATMTAYVSFRPSSAGMSGVGTDDSTPHPAQLPIAYLSSGGGFIGGLPAEGTPVVVAQAEGASNYFIVAFLARDPSARSTIGAYKIKIPVLSRDEITIQINTSGCINLNPDGIVIGEPRNAATFDTTRKVSLNTFDYNYYVGQGSKLIDSIIRRDRKPKTNYPSSMRLNDIAYDDNLKVIGMDPTFDARNSNSGTAIRNPARIEKREVVYEYEDSSQIRSNDQELEFYKTGIFPDQSYILNRRTSRVDALSLSLVSPNYLVETIKGTVVDIFGNIVDLNRTILPIGNKDTVISASKIKSTVNEQNTFNNAYEQIKRTERKSIAYHFELNARKETNGSGPPNVLDNKDYARLRSRFSFDVDKEGQFKLNVPASSETGNIPLLSRYENFSTVSPNDDTNNPNDMAFNPTYTDILTEGFANTGIVSLIDDLNNSAGAIDRFSNSYIKHGTVYHDISKTVSSLQSATFYNPVPSAEAIPTTPLGSGYVLPLTDIVSKTIITAGPTANAGGRSGSLNFDGSLEINIGANSVDRQSLWVDLQGGAVVNIGRDLKNNVSFAANCDGQVLLQIGGSTVPAESGRFQSSQTGFLAGVLDIRVLTSNSNGHEEMTVLRIDSGGVQLTSPGRLVVYAAQNILMRSSANIELDAETVIIQGRKMLKNPSSGTIR